MKKYITILSLLLLLFVNSLYSQTFIDSCKLNMIENINQRNFETAVQAMTCVKNWQFKENDSLLVVNNVLEYLSYIDSLQQDKALSDSLWNYLFKECGFWGCYYRNQRDNLKAKPYYEGLLYLYKTKFGEKSILYASSLHSMGVIYFDLEDYSKAETYYLESLKVFDALSNVKVPYTMYIPLLDDLGKLYYIKGDLIKSKDFYLRELKQKSISGEKRLDDIALLNHLGDCCMQMDEYQEAELYFLEALQIHKLQDSIYITLLHNIGDFYANIGDEVKAEENYLLALTIAKSISEKPSYVVVTSLEKLGVFYLGRDNLKAEQYSLEALELYRTIYGEWSGKHESSIFLVVGRVYEILNEYQKAKSYYLSALQASKINNEDNEVFNPMYTYLILLSLSSLNFFIGDTTEAESYLDEAIQLQHSFYPFSLINAIMLSSLGSVYNKMGNYAKAAESYLSALEVRKSLFDEYHYNYATDFNELGKIYRKLKDYSTVEYYFRQAFSISKNRFVASVDYMTERQRTKFWNKIQKEFYRSYPSFSYRYNIEKPSISTFAYDNELFTKGLLLSSSNEVQSSILNSHDTTLIRQWTELTTKKQQILALSESAPQSPYLAELQEQAEHLEKEITKKSAAFRQSCAQWATTWDSVRTHLAEGQVAIEYFSAPLNTDSTMYCALLLRNNSPYPELIPLFEEKQALSLINTTNDNQTNFTYSYQVIDTDTLGNGRKLSDIVWSKLLPHIKPGEAVYFAPSGLLHQLAIEALPYDDTRTMADVFRLVRLSSTRELVFNRQYTAHTTAALYGGIQYNMSGDELLAESEPYAATHLLASRGIANDTLNRGMVDYLPGSKTEVEQINTLLKQNNLQVRVYTSTMANEESFKALSGTHQHILHIATHGFFWADSIAQKKEFFSHCMLSLDNKRRTIPPVADPLNRCGLLLAGANTAFSGHSADLPESVQDGILTAKEISMLNLRDADLVVLSACETGKGEITGDGVFGLQRAFKQAGAQTIIMSLWPVNDHATQLLMTEFYRNWLTLRQSKREAFRNAQNIIRARYEEPVYWAGFIMLD